MIGRTAPSTAGQLLQEAALTGQLEAARAGPIDQLPDQLIVQQIRRPLDRADLFTASTEAVTSLISVLP
ncbi:hypothetical protein ACFYYN_41805 [Streptomyces sp. NPDC001902]